MTIKSDNTNSNNNSSTTNSGYVPDAAPPAPAPAAPPAPELDDLGYTKPTLPTPPAPSTEPPKKDDPPAPKTVTGYDDPPAPAEPPKKDDPPAPAEPPKKDDPPADPETELKKQKEEIDQVLKDIGEDFNKEAISKFAQEQKLSKDQVAAYVKWLKEDQANLKASQEKAIQEQRQSWQSELKNDPEFGGSNFNKNIDSVDKVIEKYLPNVKKVLTERGSMLPPYIMRDLLSLSKVLNPTTNLVNGETRTVEKETNFLDEMYQ